MRRAANEEQTTKNLSMDSGFAILNILFCFQKKEKKKEQCAYGSMCGFVAM